MKRALTFVLLLVLTAAPAVGASLLTNGDFESPPILGSGQSPVPDGASKWTTTADIPGAPDYANSISGILGWNYATPESGGIHTDIGLARLNASFSPPSDGQSLFSNRWNQLMSQTVRTSATAGTTVQASIDFGTLGTDLDGGRAGRFYLVAGEPDSADPNVFSARSIVLGERSVANPDWTAFTPDVRVGNGQYTSLALAYTFGAGDPGLGLPLSVAFRTATNSVGATYWDNASLTVTAVPEPGSSVLLGMGLIVVLSRVRRRLVGA